RCSCLSMIRPLLRSTLFPYTTLFRSPFTVYVNADSVKVQKFLLTLKDEKGQEWNRSFVLPFRPKREALSSFEIADGREVTFQQGDRKSTRLNSSHVKISYAVFCLKKK